MSVVTDGQRRQAGLDDCEEWAVRVGGAAISVRVAWCRTRLSAAGCGDKSFRDQIEHQFQAADVTAVQQFGTRACLNVSMLDRRFTRGAAPGHIGFAENELNCKAHPKSMCGFGT